MTYISCCLITKNKHAATIRTLNGEITPIHHEK